MVLRSNWGQDTLSEGAGFPQAVQRNPSEFMMDTLNVNKAFILSTIRKLRASWTGTRSLV